MAEVIGSAGYELNLRLGQSPDVKDPAINFELQQVYNSIKTLGQYLDILRVNLESAPGQDPSQSVRFRRTFWATALQNIAVGAVVSSYQNGIINGVMVSPYPAVYDDSAVTIGSTGSRDTVGVKQLQSFIALTAASVGEQVQVGVGPGIIRLTGVKCGQIVWGVGALSFNTYRNANAYFQWFYGSTLVNNGGLYLNNITASYFFPSGGGSRWEGYWLPGYPRNDNGTYLYERTFLFPIGIGVSDGFVLFSDYKRSDSLPMTYHT